jgi:hypothetical protein
MNFIEPSHCLNINLLISFGWRLKQTILSRISLPHTSVINSTEKTAGLSLKGKFENLEAKYQPHFLNFNYEHQPHLPARIVQKAM